MSTLQEVLPVDVRCRRAFWTEDLQFYTRALKDFTLPFDGDPQLTRV